jgi:hypothetical protein
MLDAQLKKLFSLTFETDIEKNDTVIFIKCNKFVKLRLCNEELKALCYQMFHVENQGPTENFFNSTKELRIDKYFFVRYLPRK